MPIDTKTKPTKPATPTLSSRFRNAKTPFAPRLAGSAPSSPVTSTPRPFKPQALSPSADGPRSPPLNGNVTPRSGARSSRIGIESPATPADSRRLSAGSKTLQALNVTGPDGVSGAFRFNTGSTAPANDKTMPGPATVTTRANDDDSKFFRADDVRPATARTGFTSPPPTRPPLRPRTAGFVRSGPGNQPPQNASPAPSVQSAPEATEDDKFFRASDVAKIAQERGARSIAVSKLSSVSGSSPGTTSPSQSRHNSTISPPLSPNKLAQQTRHRPPSPIKHFVISPQQRVSPETSATRRASISSVSNLARQGNGHGHAKAASISTVTNQAFSTSPILTQLDTLAQAPLPQLAEGRLDGTPQPLVGFLTSPETVSPRSASLTSSRTVGTSCTSEIDVSDLVKSAVDDQKHADENVTEPTTRPSSMIQNQAQIAAANARRERKVLDLEISNSSLLAINKTLERELRRQNTELRRFRRLSRSGRLSFAPSNRSVSGQSALSALSEHEEEDEGTGQNPDDIIDEESDEHESEESDSLFSESVDTSTACARKRARDERRLMLDLSKHQQLLIDSQKLTQSIRKCLSISEDLITQGTRALEYKVGIGDVKLGGRVWNEDDHAAQLGIGESDISGHALGQRRALLSPSISQAELDEAKLWLGIAENGPRPLAKLPESSNSLDDQQNLRQLSGGDLQEQLQQQ